MTKVILDGKSMLTYETLHAELKRKLDLPGYYGENLNALWDCITGWIEVPTHIVWEHVSAVRDAIPEHYIMTLKTLKEAEHEGFIDLTLVE
jgi:ribonuclease inhibitor